MTIFIVGFVSGLSLAALVVIVWAPWRQVRAEPPLDEAAESRVLLGENPEQIAHDLDEASATSPEKPAEDEWDTAEIQALHSIDDPDRSN